MKYGINTKDKIEKKKLIEVIINQIDERVLSAQDTSVKERFEQIPENKKPRAKFLMKRLHKPSCFQEFLQILTGVDEMVITRIDQPALTPNEERIKDEMLAFIGEENPDLISNPEEVSEIIK